MHHRRGYTAMRHLCPAIRCASLAAGPEGQEDQAQLIISTCWLQDL